MNARTIGVGGNILGIASTGDHTVNVQYQAEQMTVLPAEVFRPVTDWAVPRGLSNLPGRPGAFVGRASELDHLDEVMTMPGRVVVCAVHGLGGVGKSTLAAHWAARRADQNVLTWWVTADSTAGIDAGLAGLAVALQPALAGALPSEALRERAVQWLAVQDRWLVILDNVTDPADIMPLLARTSTGRYLITSRRATGWHGIAQTSRLDVLSLGEAIDMLTQITSQAGSLKLDGAEELCAELGCLPLAIEQAGAYLAQAFITPREYLGLLASYPAKIFQATSEGGDAARTVARIWHVTLDRLADTPLAGQVLRVLAWYAPNAIPRTLLDGLAEPPDLVTAIGRLAAYSMITTDGGSLAVHRLVQSVSRSPETSGPLCDPVEIGAAREQATSLLADAVPDWKDPANWPLWRTLIPHIDALASHADQETDTETTAYLFDGAGLFALSQGQASKAADYFQRALEWSTRILGADHPDTLTFGSKLASAYESAGDLNRAIALHEQILADSERILGADHPDTLTSRNNLAAAYHKTGNLDRVIGVLQQVLADGERILGADDPLTLTFRGNLASAYESAGDLDRAIALHEQVLADSERILGADHPDTLTCRNNLAVAYHKTGDLNRGLPRLERVLADRERILGADHPDTLSSRHNLAAAYKSAGDLDRAIALHERVLADSERILGADDPLTLTFRGNLAEAYESAGDLDRGIALDERVLADSERILGADHPDTLSCRSSLAAAYGSAGDLDRAITLYEQVLADSERILGADQPDTLSCCGNLAAAYKSAEKLDRAIALHERVVADSERILSADHPAILTYRNDLAVAYYSAGEWDRAIPLYERVLADSERLRGADHHRHSDRA